MYFGKVGNGSQRVHTPAAIPATATKYTPTGNMCEPTGYPECEASLQLIMFGEEDSLFALRRAGDPSASFQAIWTPDSGDADVSIQHEVRGTGPKAAFHVNTNSPDVLEQVSADFDDLAPFADGDALFNATDPPDPQDDCSAVVRQGNLDSQVTLHLDGFGVHEVPGDAALVIKVPAPSSTAFAEGRRSALQLHTDAVERLADQLVGRAT